MDSLPRLVIMASGNGSNAQAVIDACAEGRLHARVMAVVTNRVSAPVIARAEISGIPAVYVGRLPEESRADYDARLAEVVTGFDPDFVVLAGWMRVLTMSFLGWFPGMVVNLHPALPGEFPGTHAIERAFDDARHNGRTRSGVMVHLVPDEGVDDGPVLATAEVPILPTDTLADFETRVHATEHDLLVRTLDSLCTRRLTHGAPA